MERPARYDAPPPPVPERLCKLIPPPLVFADELGTDDRTWLVNHLMDQARLLGIASKRAKRAGRVTEAHHHWEISARCHRIAQALGPPLEKRTINKTKGDLP